jgi:hypothetical protein
MGLGSKDVGSDKGCKAMCVSGVMAEEVGGIGEGATTRTSLFQYEDVSDEPWFVYETWVYADQRGSEGVIGRELIHIERRIQCCPRRRLRR